MFQGPSGMLAPTPARMSQACVPRSHETWDEGGEHRARSRTRRATPNRATRAICELSPWKASMTSL